MRFFGESIRGDFMKFNQKAAAAFCASLFLITAIAPASARADDPVAGGFSGGADPTDCLVNPESCAGAPDLAKMSPAEREAYLDQVIERLVPQADFLGTIELGCKTGIPGEMTREGPRPVLDCKEMLGLGEAPLRAPGSADAPPEVPTISPGKLKSYLGAAGATSPFKIWSVDVGKILHQGLVAKLAMNYVGLRPNYLDPKNPLQLEVPMCIQRAGEGLDAGNKISASSRKNVTGSTCGRTCEFDVVDTGDMWNITARPGDLLCRVESAWFRGDYAVGQAHFWLEVASSFIKNGAIELADFDGKKACGANGRDIMKVTKKLEVSLRLFEKAYKKNHPETPDGWKAALSCADPATAMPGVCSLGMARRQLQDMWVKFLSCEMNARSQKEFLSWDPSKMVVQHFDREDVHQAFADMFDGGWWHGSPSSSEATTKFNEMYKKQIIAATSKQISNVSNSNWNPGDWGFLGGQADYSTTVRYPAMNAIKVKEIIIDPVKAFHEGGFQDIINRGGDQSSTSPQSDLERLMASLGFFPLLPFSLGSLTSRRKRRMRSSRMLLVLGSVLVGIFSVGCDNGISSACEVHCSQKKFACERQCHCDCGEAAGHNLAADADDPTCPMISVLGAGESGLGGNTANDANDNISDFFNQMPSGGEGWGGGTQADNDGGLEGDLNGDGVVDEQDEALGGGNAEAGLAGTNGFPYNNALSRNPATGGGAAAGVAGRAANGAGGTAAGTSAMMAQAGLLGGSGTGSDQQINAQRSGGSYQGNAGPGYESGSAAMGGGASGMGYNGNTGDISLDGSAVQAMDQYLEKTKSTSLFDIVSRRYDRWGKSISPH